MTLNLKNAFLQFSGISDKIDEVKKKIATLSGQDAPENQNKAYWEKRKKEATEALESMNKADLASENGIKQRNLLKEANKNLTVWDFSDKAKVDPNIKRQAELDYKLRLNNDEKKADLDAYNQKLDSDKRLLDLEVDSFSKRQRLLDIQLNQEVIAEAKRQQTLLEAQQSEEREDWKIKGEKGVFTPETLTLDDLYKIKPEELTISKNNLVIAKKEYDKGIDDILSGVIDKYKDYNAQRLDLEKQYSKDLSILDEKRTDQNKEQVDRAKAELEKQRQSLYHLLI